MYQDYYTRPDLYCNVKDEPVETMEYNVLMDPSMLLPSTYMMMPALDTSSCETQPQDDWWAVSNDSSALSSPTELSLSHPSYSPYSDSISQPSPIDTSFEYYPQQIDVATPAYDYYYYPSPTCEDAGQCGCHSSTPVAMSPTPVYEEQPQQPPVSTTTVTTTTTTTTTAAAAAAAAASTASSTTPPHESSAQQSSTNASLRPYPCYLCTRAFARKHDLQRHIRVHTGAKPYACLCCKKAFARTDALKRHLRMEEACRTSPEIQAMKCAGKRRYRNL